MTAAREWSGPGAVVSEIGGVTMGRDGDRVSVRMWGEHDLSTVDLLGAALVEAIAAGDLDVVVDLSDVSFMDVSTAGALVQGRALLKVRGRRLTVQSTTPAHRRLLEMCDLGDLIEPTPSEESWWEPGAATPLEAWVEVPTLARPSQGSPPVEIEPARNEPERVRW